jgi:hypothetical protein
VNLYILVEGSRTEPKLLRGWLPELAPGYTEAERLEDVQANQYRLVAGRGYPSYIDRLEAAAEDIRAFPVFGWLVVIVDAEDLSVAERRAELEEVLREVGCDVPWALLIADCCVETWLLGHRTLVKRNPASAALRAHLAHYDVTRGDPEHMPSGDPELNRAQYHHAYLREVFRERGLSFTKSDPGDAATVPYLRSLEERCQTTDHLRSLAELLDFFSRLPPTTLPSAAHATAGVPLDCKSIVDE